MERDLVRGRNDFQVLASSYFLGAGEQSLNNVDQPWDWEGDNSDSVRLSLSELYFRVFVVDADFAASEMSRTSGVGGRRTT